LDTQANREITILATGRMSAGAGEFMMLRMTTAIAASRLVLVGPTKASHGRDGAVVRRYRLARLKVEGERRPGAARHEHLKRLYD
jgi:hypothetical protein